jgi:hypothetical protein
MAELKDKNNHINLFFVGIGSDPRFNDSTMHQQNPNY